MRFFRIIAMSLAMATLVFSSISYARESIPAAGKIAFTSDRKGNFDIYTMDEDGGHVENIIKHPAIDTDVSWSPDGSMIAFSRWRSGIYIVSINEQKLKPVTDSTGICPLLSPNGTKLAFVEEPIAFTLWLCVMDIDGKSRKRLIQLHDLNDEPHTWSPDGRQIAFCDSGNVYIVDVNSKNCKGIICTAPDGTTICAVDVDWSPTGDKLAIAAVGDTQGIWIANCDGSDARRITEDKDRSPEWSPDGTQIAFHSSRDGDWDIYVMDADGQNIKGLTENTASDLQPAWFKPTGQSVLPKDKLPITWGKIKKL